VRSSSRSGGLQTLCSPSFDRTHEAPSSQRLASLHAWVQYRVPVVGSGAQIPLWQSVDSSQISPKSRPTVGASPVDSGSAVTPVPGSDAMSGSDAGAGLVAGSGAAADSSTDDGSGIGVCVVAPLVNPVATDSLAKQTRPELRDAVQVSCPSQAASCPSVVQRSMQ
jgi:hypothetical protein